MVSGKTTLQDEEKHQKTEVFQSFLPRFRERKTLNPFDLKRNTMKYIKHTNDVLLSKEMENKEEILVVYKPNEALSAVYKVEGVINR